MILDAWGWCTGTTQRDGMGREEGSGWGIHVHLWWIHFDSWQNQYNIVKFKNKIKLKKKKKKTGRTLFDINHSKMLYDPLPRVMEMKTKINKWDLIKLESFCATKETISKVKKKAAFRMGENNSK